MPAYDEHRRATAVPRLTAITKNEAAENSDLELQRTYEREREAIADDLRRAREGRPKREFAALVKRTR